MDAAPTQVHPIHRLLITLFSCRGMLQSVERFKETCMQVIEELLGRAIDYDKIAATAETAASTSDIKASIAAMSFILSR